MWNWIYKVASPKTCYFWAQKLQPWIAVVCIFSLLYGLFGALYLAPPDYQQGNVFRIMYIHVPAAILSLGIYMVMTVTTIVFMVWKIKVADVIAKISAPIGACFTALTLITGSIWGKPTWGTWWIWDARLTSELILLFIYLGIIAMRSAFPERELAARASGIVTIVGVINIPIVHYSVDWWQTLHQGASILKLGSPSIAPSMLHPLLIMIVGFLFYYIWYLLINLRRELLQRENDTAWVQDEIAKGVK